MAGRHETEASKEGREPGPGVIVHVTDQGATSPEAAPCTTDLEPPSALGGGSSTRSNTASPGADQP